MLSRMASSDEDDCFFDAKEDISKSRSNTLEYQHAETAGLASSTKERTIGATNKLSDETSSEKNEFDELLRAKEKLARQHEELERRHREEAQLLEQKFAELKKKKREELQLSKSAPYNQRTDGDGTNTPEELLDIKESRKRLEQLRDNLRSNTSPFSSFDEDRLKGSSLERAKATLNWIKTDSDPNMLVDYLFAGRELDDGSDSGSDENVNDTGIQSTGSHSSSTPLSVISKDDHPSLNLVSPISSEDTCQRKTTPNRVIESQGRTTPNRVMDNQPGLYVDLDVDRSRNTQPLITHEPDIITSSKSQLPEAPPRSKKSPSPLRDDVTPRIRSISMNPRISGATRTSYSDEESDDGFETALSENRGRTGLTLERTGSLRNLSGLGSPSLNIKAATLGRLHITTQEADEAAQYCRADTLPLRHATLGADTESLLTSSTTCYTLNRTADFPLEEHMQKLSRQTSKIYRASRGSRGSESDGESSVSSKSNPSAAQKSIKKGGHKLKKFLGKAFHSFKSKPEDKEATMASLKEKEKESAKPNQTAAQEEQQDDGFSFRSTLSNSWKGPPQFDGTKLVQDMSGEHNGPVWIIKFSNCGRLLATGGQDTVIRVWALKDSHEYFDQMKTQYSDNGSALSSENLLKVIEEPPGHRVSSEEESPFMNKIFISYRGHTADIMDFSWSKNKFLLSSSMDKTVRLWHIYREECLCCFQHIDFVTAIVFHPKDDRYFLSGSLDGKIRLWSIPEKKVSYWNEIIDGRNSQSSQLITAVNFCSNGQFAVVGTYDGRCIFYTADQLKFYTSIQVRSTRGKNKVGHKVTGIQPLNYDDKILVTTNDSRLRLYDLRDLSLVCKYRGASNTSSQIRADFSHDGQFILCGSEDFNVYFWRTYHHEFAKFLSLDKIRKDRNYNWESIKAHSAVVTAAVFAPKPNLFFNMRASGSLRSTDTLVGNLSSDKHNTGSSKSKSTGSFGKSTGNSLSSRQVPNYGYVVVTADYSGSIKVLSKPLTPSS